MYRQAAISPFIVFHLPTRTTWFHTRDSTALILEKGSVTKAKKQKMKNNQGSVFVIFSCSGLLLLQKYLMIGNWIISCFLVNESWFSVRYFKIIESFFGARIA